MAVKPIAKSYWRLIKANKKTFSSVPESVEEDVKTLAKQDVSNGEITPEKYKELVECLQVKKNSNSIETVFFNENELLRLICGLEVKITKLFPDSGYEDVKISLDSEDEKLAEMLSALNDDHAALLLSLKKIFDWSVLADIIGNGKCISDHFIAAPYPETPLPYIEPKSKTVSPLSEFCARYGLGRVEYLSA